MSSSGDSIAFDLPSNHSTDTPSPVKTTKRSGWKNGEKTYYVPRSVLLEYSKKSDSWRRAGSALLQSLKSPKRRHTGERGHNSIPLGM